MNYMIGNHCQSRESEYLVSQHGLQERPRIFDQTGLATQHLVQAVIAFSGRALDFENEFGFDERLPIALFS